MWQSSLISPISNYLRNETLPEDRSKAVKVKAQAARDTLKNNILYRQSFSGPYQRRVPPDEVKPRRHLQCPYWRTVAMSHNYDTLFLLAYDEARVIAVCEKNVIYARNSTILFMSQPRCSTSCQVYDLSSSGVLILWVHY